ncbi:hypothetical protein [Ferrovibrio sp.]|uniref:hypothetical protein n=1 Tax=Ferrovibrio sp. TaxID=1917215 RepID=UPI00311FFA1E
MRRASRPGRHIAYWQVLLAAGLAAGSLAAAPACAQPIRLIPPPAAPAETAPADPAPVPLPPPQLSPPGGQTGTPPAAIQNAPDQPATAPAETSDFVVRPLQAPDPSAAGLLDDTNGGLGVTMWRGSDRIQAVRAIGVLPGSVRSVALHGLQRRLLLTTAEVPGGNPGTPSLLGLRVTQLYRIGDIAAAQTLAVPRPAGLKDPVFLQLPAEAALLKDDTAQACGMSEQGLREDGSSFWQKLNVLCRYQARDVAGGDLALSLWRDGGGDDPAFNALAAALRGDAKVKIETLGGGSALHFAMLRAAGRPLPKDTLDVAPPALLAALAGYDKAEAELRLEAAEQAAAYGALPAAALGEAYAGLAIPEAARAAMAGGKSRETGPRAAAYLYQSVQSAADPATRIDLLQRAWDLAQTRNLALPTAALYRPQLAALAPAENAAAAAPAIIRMALAAGETETARRWGAMLMLMPPERDRAGDLAAAAWPLLLLAGDDNGEWRDSRFDAWLATLDALPPAERNARAALLLVLAEGAGVAVPAERWDGLLTAAAEKSATGQPQASLAVWRNLLRSVSANARAESLALALALLGPDGTAQADGQSLATALGALRSVGLTAEARQVALEAALLRGF